MSSVLVVDGHTVTVPFPYHTGSHRNLLSITSAPGNAAGADAIIVPTVRPVRFLRTAVDLAAVLDCALVALCSGRASPSETASYADAKGVELVAVDTTNLPVGIVPQLSTDRMLAGTRFERDLDTSLKRNLGLLLSRLVGWERVIFLDDDVSVPNPDDLRSAVELLDQYSCVGLTLGGFPDNSVVCHAHRDTGGEQGTFIGGGALAVGPAAMNSFFPDIYNEDWFFLLDGVTLRSSAVTGMAEQAAYNPYADRHRAMSEELGDCLAEGVYCLLDEGGCVADADTAYWHGFLRKRSRFIAEVIDRACRHPELADRRQMLAALRAARRRNRLIDPVLCVEYLTAWRADGKAWRLHIEGLGRGRTMADALSELGLARRSTCVPRRDRDQLVRASVLTST